MIARFDQMYLSTDDASPDRVLMTCDICGRQIMDPTVTINVSEIIRIAAVHQSTDHA